MNTEYAKCLAWAFDYISHRIDRATEFPNGDRYGAVNIITEIVRTLEGRIIQPEYKRVILSCKAASDCLKRVREAARIPSVRPKLQNEKDRLLENARALDSAIAESNQWYADRGIKDPMQSMLLTNLVWRRSYIADRHGGTARTLHLPPEKITEADLRLISAAANVFDAATAAASEDFQSVAGLMTGAALLVSGADLPMLLSNEKKKIPRLGGKNRHVGTEPLKAWIVETVESRHKATPFKSRIEAAKNIEADLIEEAKNHSLKITQFTPENAREFAERALAAKSPSFKAKKASS